MIGKSSLTSPHENLEKSRYVGLTEPEVRFNFSQQIAPFHCLSEDLAIGSRPVRPPHMVSDIDFDEQDKYSISMAQAGSATALTPYPTVLEPEMQSSIWSGMENLSIKRSNRCRCLSIMP